MISIERKYYTFIYKLIFSSLICLSAFAILACNNKSGAKPKVLDSIDYSLSPDQISNNFDVTFVDSSWVKARLRAGRARIYQSRYETLIDKGLKLDLYDKNSLYVSTWLTADSARIDDRTRDMLARGHITVYSDSSKTKLETELLQWDQKGQKFFSSEFVRITSPMETIEGYGFESDQYLLNYKIFKVSGVKR